MVLAITSVFRPDPDTHVEIVKYPDESNAMKWFFGLSVGGASTSMKRTMDAAYEIHHSPEALYEDAV